MNIKLGFDLNCFSNRLVEPEAWTDFVAECGIDTVQYNYDMLDFLLPRRIWERIAARTVALCRERGIRIKCSFGGHNHHQNYLGHPCDEVARAYEDQYKLMADVTAALGGEGFGTCFAITTTSVQNNPTRRKEIMQRAIEAYWRIGEYAKPLGLQYLMFETTSVPRESCATFDETDWVLEQMSKAPLPMRLCLDVGHRNQEDPASPEADPLEWIRRYAAVTPLIHIQQCNAGGSHHWPFTEPYNRQGDIHPEILLETLRSTGIEHEILLALEIRHRSYFPDEYLLEKNLKESVLYWKEWVRKEDETNLIFANGGTS